MSWLRCSSVLFLVGAVMACSSATPGGAPEPSGTAGRTGTADTSGVNGCTVSFGGDAASAQATSCSVVQPNADDSSVFEVHGDATGLDSPTYSIRVSFPDPPVVKTYSTADLFAVSNKLSVASTGKAYDVAFEASDATKQRYGSVTATFTSVDHGTIDIVYDTNRDFFPTQHATAHITF